MGPKTFYWISPGRRGACPALTAVWTLFPCRVPSSGPPTPANTAQHLLLAGAEQWAEDSGDVHSGDAAQQEAPCARPSLPVRTGLSPPAPIPAASCRWSTRSMPQAFPVININTSDDAVADFPAYVGNDLVHRRATLGPVPCRQGACRPRAALSGCRSRCRAPPTVSKRRRASPPSSNRSGITWEVTDATLDQAEVITRMSDYLLANQGEIDAIIGLGDMVTGSIQRVFNQVGRRAGRASRSSAGAIRSIPRSAVLDGYVNAAMWQDPQAHELCRPLAWPR
jgi:simple sugar transport system substrate-binding protein